MKRLAWGVVLLIAGAACGDTAPTVTAASPSGSVADDARAAESGANALAAGCANVVGVVVTPAGDGYRFDVTVRSADTGPDKYADLWEVRDEAGAVLGSRELLHHHAGEQPFTRSLDGVAIPEGVRQVTVAARDSIEGFCGDTLSVAVPRP